MLTTPDDHDSPQSLPASSTPEIEPQVNGRRDNSTVTVTTVQPTSGMDIHIYILIYTVHKKLAF